MLRNRLLNLLVLGACCLTASAAWADEVGYVDCTNHPEDIQVFAKARRTPDLVASLPCGERFTVLIYGFVFSRVQTKDGNVGYIYSNLIAVDRAATSAQQTPSAQLAAAKQKLPSTSGAVARPVPAASLQPRSTSARPAEAQAPEPTTSKASETSAAVAEPAPIAPMQPQPTTAQPAPECSRTPTGRTRATSTPSTGSPAPPISDRMGLSSWTCHSPTWEIHRRAHRWRRRSRTRTLRSPCSGAGSTTPPLPIAPQTRDSAPPGSPGRSVPSDRERAGQCTLGPPPPSSAEAHRIHPRPPLRIPLADDIDRLVLIGRAHVDLDRT